MPKEILKAMRATIPSAKPTIVVVSQTASASRIAQDDQADYEGELTVVMGKDAKDAKDVSESEALRYVLGYTVGNDVSSR